MRLISKQQRMELQHRSIDEWKKQSRRVMNIWENETNTILEIYTPLDRTQNIFYFFYSFVNISEK